MSACSGLATPPLEPQSTAVVELEGTWLISRAWRLWLKAGTRLWGPTLPGTYDRQLETGVRPSL